MPSRNILHVRSRGSKSRFRVVSGFGWRAPKTYFKKSKVVEVRPILTSSGTLFFWVPVCALSILSLQIGGSNKNLFLDSICEEVAGTAHARCPKKEGP